MKAANLQSIVRLLLVLAVAWVVCFAAEPSGAIRGVVRDPTGALVPGAQVTAITADGFTKRVIADAQGRYNIIGLPAGEYELRISAPGFSEHSIGGLRVDGASISYDAALALSSVKEEVTVPDSAPPSADPSTNASATVLKGKDLDALADDPDDLASDLLALAGPAAGPDGGEIFVDGFSNAKLPPKSSIREIRVNQNPFSAEYDRLGYGRVDIFTKPGTDKFRGDVSFMFADSMFNSRNPFSLTKPPYPRRQYDATFAGPLGKRASFSLTYEGRDLQEKSIINALVLDPSLNVTSLKKVVDSPVSKYELSGRLDYQLTAGNTLVGRYEWERVSMMNAGLDTFSLPSRASNREFRYGELQATDTAVLNPTTIQELRFQYSRWREKNRFASSDPGLIVPDAFSTGGNGSGDGGGSVSRWELGEVLSMSRGRHMIKFGGRLRNLSQSDTDPRGFNGTFRFASLDAYRSTLIGIQNGWSAQQIRAAGGGPMQFSMTAGDPEVAIRQFDAGVFLQDDFRVRPQLTLSAGIRYEGQTNLSDHRSIAPRLGFAWAPGATQNRRQPPLVIRGGFGIFYTRVSEGVAMWVARLNGVRQQEFLVPNPDFYPAIPTTAELQDYAQAQAIRRRSGDLRSPYTMQAAFSVERQLPKNINLSLTYANSRGVQGLRSRNINAPLAEVGVRPDEGGPNIYLYESGGLFRQNQITANFSARINPRIGFSGYYSWSKASSDYDRPGGFPSNQYDVSLDYGRAGFDQRHRVFLSGSLTGPKGVSLSPFLIVNSGAPFNITVGRDLNGDAQFNDRPAWATDLSRPSVVLTRYGAFDTDPLPGQIIIPRNLGNGPGMVAVNLRLAKSFGFGEKTGKSQPAQPRGAAPPPPGPIGHGEGGGERGGMGAGPSSGSRYSVTFAVVARNLLNTVNLASPVGNLSSPSFGRSVAITGMGRGSFAVANRSVDLQVRFTF